MWTASCSSPDPVRIPEIGGGVLVIEAVGYVDISVVGRHVVGGIEADPAKPLDMDFRPGVACGLIGRVLHHQITRDIARRKSHHPGRGGKGLGVILADALFGGQRVLGHGPGSGWRRAHRPWPHASLVIRPWSCSSGLPPLFDAARQFADQSCRALVSAVSRWYSPQRHVGPVRPENTDLVMGFHDPPTATDPDRVRIPGWR